MQFKGFHIYTCKVLIIRFISVGFQTLDILLRRCHVIHFKNARFKNACDRIFHGRKLVSQLYELDFW